MSGESQFIESLRALADNAQARGLLDDAAVIAFGGARLVLTHDMIVEGVHFLASDPPGDVAWKLVAVNLSDLAAKGGRPVGALLGYSLGSDPDWDRAFVAGLGSALRRFDLALLGGDTVSPPPSAPRSLGLTAIGEASGAVPSRSGASPGDEIWVSGTIGDSGAGLAIAQGALQGADWLVERYRRPEPRLDAGRALAPLVSAMMDVSDGLLIDLSRLARASGAGALVDLDAVPLSKPYRLARGSDRPARLAATTSGDDYELLFCASADQARAIRDLSRTLDLAFSMIGRIVPGNRLEIKDEQGRINLPDRLGYQHGAG